MGFGIVWLERIDTHSTNSENIDIKWPPKSPGEDRPGGLRYGGIWHGFRDLSNRDPWSFFLCALPLTWLGCYLCTGIFLPCYQLSLRVSIPNSQKITMLDSTLIMSWFPFGVCPPLTQEAMLLQQGCMLHEVAPSRSWGLGRLTQKGNDMCSKLEQPWNIIIYKLSI